VSILSDRLMTTAELAEKLRTPGQTLYKWRAEGRGPRSRKVGRRLLYAESDVEAWLESLDTHRPAESDAGNDLDSLLDSR
jgi:excisionase family DNA binding protein